MPKYKVQKNPFHADDFEVVEADTITEAGSYTQFLLNGDVVLALPTILVTSIKVEPEG